MLESKYVTNDSRFGSDEHLTSVDKAHQFHRNLRSA